mgnify:FL=1
MKIKTAFIFDPMSDIDGEVDLAVSEINRLLDSDDVVKTAYKPEAITSEFMKKSFDLVIIDYGGMSTWGNSGATMQVDAACNYAEENPSSLVVIWTGYTANVYEDELKETFGHLKNIMCRYKDSGHVYSNLDGDPEFIKNFRDWFSEYVNQSKPVKKPKLKTPGRKNLKKEKVQNG